MPRIQVVFFEEEDGSVPLLDWFDRLPAKAQDKCRVQIERLRHFGHDLRRPAADYLRDGIYELRVRLGSVNYRMLYVLSRANRRHPVPWIRQRAESPRQTNRQSH